jgi:hypothetical protein
MGTLKTKVLDCSDRRKMANDVLMCLVEIPDPGKSSVFAITLVWAFAPHTKEVEIRIRNFFIGLFPAV